MPSTSSLATTDVASPAPRESPAVARPVDTAHCRHCDSALVGRHCHACGEDALPPETSWQGSLTQWHRLVRTMRSPWFRPGEMAVRHLHGARIGYIPPIALPRRSSPVVLFSAATQFRLPIIVTAVGILARLAWNVRAGRRITTRRWPLAIASGVFVVVCGAIIDRSMSQIAVGVALRLA